jgi:hypothetical protein
MALQGEWSEFALTAPLYTSASVHEAAITVHNDIYLYLENMILGALSCLPNIGRLTLEGSNDVVSRMFTSCTAFQ